MKVMGVIGIGRTWETKIPGRLERGKGRPPSSNGNGLRGTQELKKAKPIVLLEENGRRDT